MVIKAARNLPERNDRKVGSSTGSEGSVRKGNKCKKTYPMIRCGFARVTPPDGRSLRVQAPLANFRVGGYADSERAASTVPPCKGKDIRAMGALNYVLHAARSADGPARRPVE